MKDPLNDNSERRLTLTFVFSFAILAISLFFMPKPKQKTLPEVTSTNQTVAATEESVEKSQSSVVIRDLISKIKFKSTTKSTNVVLQLGNQMKLNVDTHGGRISSLQIDGDWNRKKSPVVLSTPELKFQTGDLLPGSYEMMAESSNRPVYTVLNASENQVVLSADFLVGKQSLRVLKTYQILSNYRFSEKVSLMNLTKKPLIMDLSGSAFSLVIQYDLMAGDSANNRNPLVAKYFNGEKLQRALGGGLFKKGKSSQQVEDFKWIDIQNNYFMAVVEPRSGQFKGTFLRLSQNPRDSKAAFFLSQDAVTLAPGESKTFELAYYVGPRKEKLLKKANPSYAKLFSWPGIFNPIMKPIEWGIGAIMFFLAKFIPNWGVIVILLALVVKLILSPLSINAAISMKRMHLLQPKIKNLQEKYKDDQQVQQQKLGELYKKEKVNPAGGCLPMLLQMPVFVVLFQFLNHLVEIKGASFLWVKDLTQPDTLFKLQLPFLGHPFNFNLLPLLMVVFQLISTYLQSTRQQTQQAGAMNPYLTPVIFLFFFWNMPAGLVLYWTIQNIYTIVEQEVVNMDKYLKLK